MKNLYNSTISKNLIANIFGVGIQLINQVILIPLYLIYWPIDLYSDWIVITALSAFFPCQIWDLTASHKINFRFHIIKIDYKNVNPY